jgi:hypothetical protein
LLLSLLRFSFCHSLWESACALVLALPFLPPAVAAP